jgi:spore germination protein (amino acid permease)
VKSSITNRQLFFLLFLTLTTYTIISIPEVVAQGPGSGGWLSILVASLFFAASAALIVRLNSAFPGMMLYDYTGQIVGKFFAVLFAVYFILYFLLVSTYLNHQLTSVLRAEFYPMTPERVMLVVSVLVFGCVAYRGVTNVARFFEILGIIVLITAIITNAIMAYQGDLHEIMPFFRASKWKEYLFGVKDMVLAFLGVEVLTVMPLNGQNVKRSVIASALSILFIGLFYITVVEACIMMLGRDATQNYSFALIEAIKMIENPIVERFDILYLTVGFAGLVAGISAVYLALVEYVVKLVPKLSRLAVVALVGAVMIGLGILVEPIRTIADVLEAVLRYAGLVSAFAIPLVLFLIMKVKGIDKKAG